MAKRKTAACQPKLLDYNNKEYFEYAGAAGGFIYKFGFPFTRGRILNEIEKDSGQYSDEKEIFDNEFESSLEKNLSFLENQLLNLSSPASS